MKFTTVAATLALPLLAVATPWGTPTTTPVKTSTVTVTATATPTNVQSCSTGSVQCCSSVQESNAGGLVGVLLGLLGVVLDAVVPIGITCSPITVVGVSGTNCASQTVCCENDSFNGIIAIGCTPININL